MPWVVPWLSGSRPSLRRPAAADEFDALTWWVESSHPSPAWAAMWPWALVQFCKEQWCLKNFLSRPPSPNRSVR